jgi:hypothetical protein
VDESEEKTFIVREIWDRSGTRESGYFWALELDENRNLCAFNYNEYGRISIDNCDYLSEDDFLADDWYIFDIVRWEVTKR